MILTYNRATKLVTTILSVISMFLYVVPCSGSSSAITAPVIETPLLHDWIQIIDEGKVAIASKPYFAINKNQMIDSNKIGQWITDFSATICNNSAIVIIDSESFNGKGGKYIFYLDSTNQRLIPLSQMFQFSKVPKGVVFLVSNNRRLAGILCPDDMTLPFGMALKFGIDDLNQINASILPEDQIPTELSAKLEIVGNVKKHHSEIIRPLTGQVVCDAARFDKSRILFHSETVGLAHDNIEEVGIQRLVNGKQDDELFWYKRNKDNTGWDITTLPLTQHCIDTSLPALFRQSHNPEFNSTPHLCSDGSIIFRYAFHIGRTGGEELVLSTLLRQKPEGPISVLTWEAWYTCSAAGPYESAPTPSVLRRTWYPDESGKIISAYPRTTFSPNELLFDIDTTNDYLIFLRGGRLWKLNLDK